METVFRKNKKTISLKVSYIISSKMTQVTTVTEMKAMFYGRLILAKLWNYDEIMITASNYRYQFFIAYYFYEYDIHRH